MAGDINGASGTYNVRDNELRSEIPEPAVRTVKCVVAFLDGTQHTFEVDRRGKAHNLLNAVFTHLELVEKDYFGLQFIEAVEHGQDVARWVDPLRTLKRQIKTEPPYLLYFRVKFYVSDPSRLQEEYTRYHFYLQLKRDILEGKLYCPKGIAALLCSYCVQSELGDYSPDDHKAGYISEFKFIPNQDGDFEREVARLHLQHKGQTPADAEFKYLERARHLEMYGVDLHPARDAAGTDIKLGVTHGGLVVFQNNTKLNTFVWYAISKISFKRKHFFLEIRSESNREDTLVGFTMLTYRSCKNLWKSCVEHHSFFRLQHVKGNPRKWYHLGSKFRYSGRTEYEAQQENRRLGRGERAFERTPSKRARHTIGGITASRSSVLERRDSYGGSSNYSSSVTPKPPLRNSFSSKTRSSYSLDQKPPQPPSLHHHSWLAADTATLPPPLPLPPRDDDDGGFLNGSSSKRTSIAKRDSIASRETAISASKVVVSLRENGSLHAGGGGGVGGGGSAGGGSYRDNGSYDVPAYTDIPNENGFLDSHSLVTIRMKPDEQGRFGFNVKGGADQGMPIIVSRVAAGMPADLCVPRLNEGDQVLFINGRDVTQHSHEQVVMFIRAARETHTGELVLIVRPNVYVGEDYREPELTYSVADPRSHAIGAPPSAAAVAAASGSSGLDPLSESLVLLQEALANGAALAQFEQLYRRKAGMTNLAAKLPGNAGKNRYRDISPYDQTRVMLRGGGIGTTDYINANYVNMEIPGSGIVNRYIAAQGPLASTCEDFWLLVWEQRVTLVVMLTELQEKGRAKCHQYWPHLYETTDFGALQLTCLKEREGRAVVVREFTLVSVDTGEERRIEQMQYVAWPDHGVPDDSSDFLDFVVRVRQRRVGMVEPTLVHCSAGIGRTGVLILMETAMCLVEANRPVYPLDIVRQMRDQRAMLIQTGSQYKFVCEAILRVYNEGLIKPVEDYRG